MRNRLCHSVSSYCRGSPAKNMPCPFSFFVTIVAMHSSRNNTMFALRSDPVAISLYDNDMYTFSLAWCSNVLEMKNVYNTNCVCFVFYNL